MTSVSTGHIAAERFGQTTVDLGTLAKQLSNVEIMNDRGIDSVALLNLKSLGLPVFTLPIP